MTPTITQADRDAAARLATLAELRPLLLSGSHDDHPYIQAFAAHREIRELTGGQQERKRADIMFTSNAELRATLMTRDGIISQLQHTIAAHREAADSLAEAIEMEARVMEMGAVKLRAVAAAYRAATKGE